MTVVFTLPEPDKEVGDANPPGDMNQVIIAATAMGATYNVLNATYAGGADPTGDTDSTAAINAAYAALPDSGGTIVIPPGTYKISGQLTPPSYSVTQGAGASATVISQTSTTAHGFYANNEVSIAIRGLWITGPGNSDANTGSGIYVTTSDLAVSNCEFTNLIIKNFGVDGFYGNGLITSKFSVVEVIDCANNGFNIIDGTSLTWDGGCYANGIAGYGYLLNGTVYSCLNGCASDGGAGGYNLESVIGVALNGCGSESQSVFGCKINGGSNVTLASFYNRVNPGIAIWVTGDATNVVLISPVERSPGGGATASIQFDSGSTGVVIAPTTVTATAYNGTVNAITP